ncbi:DUF6760 family protein [[Clostridium] innocuum]|uniref:DUF6760 family protein n=1 Tax=Clostridium innocuum TaxID=1522 RepID=UPI0027DC99BD|nr:DUF6760 family protein [[Clostridium] innocuum]
MLSAGLSLYSRDTLYEQISFLAYYFHWSYDELLLLPHIERNRFCDEAGRINRRANGEAESIFDI